MSILLRLLSGCWWLLVVCLVLLAGYVGVGRLVFSSLDAYQSELADYLGARGFQHVEIGRIEGSWYQFDPQLSVTHFRLGRSSAALLELDRFSVRLDTFNSLLSRQLILKELEASGIRFTLDRDAEGRMTLSGISGAPGSFDWQYLLDALPHLNRLLLDDIDISVTGLRTPLHLRSSAEPIVVLSQDDIQDENQGAIKGVIQAAIKNVIKSTAKKQFSLSLYVDRTLADARLDRSRIGLTGTYMGQPEDADFYAELYLDVPHLALGDFLSGLPQLRVNNQPLNVEQLSAEVWIAAHDGELDITSRLALRGIHWAREEEGRGMGTRVTLLDLAETEFRLLGHRDEAGMTGSIYMPELLLSRGADALRLDALQFALSRAGDKTRFAAYMPRLELAPLMPLVGNLATELVPGPLSTGLKKVNLRGRMTELLFSSDKTLGKGRLVAGLDGLAMDAHAGSPSIDGLHGLLSMSRDQGYIDVSNEAFSLHFANVFAQPWHFTSARGRLRYQKHAQYMLLDSGLLEVLNQEQIAHGKLLFKLPPAQEERTWSMLIGVKNTRLLEAKAYIPMKLPPTLATWLDTGIKGGTSLEAGLLFHGALSAAVPASRKVYDLFFKVEDTRLRYHQDWPEIEGIDGTVHVANHAVTVKDAVGRVYNTQLSSAALRVPIDARSRRVEQLLLDASARGPAADVLRLLNETPLADTINQITAQWSAAGEAEATLQLNIPIGQQTGKPVYSDIQFTFQDAQLVMPEYDLDFSQLSGTGRYQTIQGLSSEGFTGLLFGEAVSGTIASQRYGAAELNVNLQGTVAAHDLHIWSDIALLSRAEGSADYALSLHIPYSDGGDGVYVEATSDLTGVTLNLPPPFRKSNPDEVRHLTYRQDFLHAGAQVAVQLDDPVSSVIATGIQHAEQWRVHINHASLRGLVTLSDQEDLPISIALAFLKIDQPEGAPDDLLASLNPLEVAAVDFSTEKLLLNGMDLGAWSFDYRVEDDTARLTHLVATLPGLQILGTSHLSWRPGAADAQTLFQGEILVTDLAETLPILGLAPSIEADDLKLSAELHWAGSPAMLGFNRVQGRLKIHGGAGRFVQADIGSSLKLLGIFDFAHLAKRFRLDFSDISGKGFEFNDIRGEVALHQGVVEVVQPVLIQGSVGQFKLGGKLDFNTQAVDSDMIVTLPVSQNLPWYAAYSAVTVGPLTGIWIMLARYLFRKKIDQFSSAKYHISGTVDAPEIKFVGIFDDRVRATSSAPKTE